MADKLCTTCHTTRRVTEIMGGNYHVFAICGHVQPITSYEVGDHVIPADPEGMLDGCPTYHSEVAYGRITAIDATYVCSIVVQWVNRANAKVAEPGPQSTVYAMPPSMLVAQRCVLCGTPQRDTAVCTMNGSTHTTTNPQTGYAVTGIID